MLLKRILLVSLLTALAGCLGLRESVVEVVDVDGSSDHRLFRLGAATRVMLEPVLWRLEDRKLIDFDRSVADYFKGELPPEYADVTLRMLHDNQSGLPRTLIDPLALPDLGETCWQLTFGGNPTRVYDRRDAFVERLWDIRFRKAVARRRPQISDVGYALMTMAICDHLGQTLDELCDAYLVEPYGLKDTAFVATQGMRARLTKSCAGSLPLVLWRGAEVADGRGEGEIPLFSGGMLSSPSDILKVCYVILPHLDRAKGIFEETTLPCGRTVSFCLAETAGGRIFVGFEKEDAHVALIVRNDTGFALKEGFDLMENMVNPPRDE